MTDLLLLERPEELTPEVLTEVLRRAGRLRADQVVTQVEARSIGTGQMGDTSRFSYHLADGATGTVVGKFASADPGSRAVGLALRAYEIEVSFYRDLASRVQMRVPGCLHAVVDPTTGTFTLLLDDAGDAVQGDQLEGCSVDAARTCLTELAGLHGPTLNDRAVAALGWLNRSTPEGEATTAALVGSLLPGFCERYRSDLTADQVAIITEVIEQMPARVGRRSPLHAATHGDFRLDNLLFAPGGGAPVVVDFQTMAWAHPALDVAYFIAGSLPAEARRANEAQLLSHYLDQLDRYLDQPLDRPAFLAAYADEAVHGIIMAVGASMLVARTERGDQMFLTSARRHADHLRDLRDAPNHLEGFHG